MKESLPLSTTHRMPVQREQETAEKATGTQSEAPLRRLQRQLGNQAVQRLVDLSRQPDDGGDVSGDIERNIETARSGGRPLDRTVRAQMEPALGADFGGVRVHTGARADQLNQSLSARAFTTGQDIFFKGGEYNPGSSSGRELLAHELTHVVQQNGGLQTKGDEIQTKLALGQPGDRYEQEADQVAKAVTREASRPAGEQAGLQRQAEDDEELQLQRQAEDDEELQLQRQPEEDDELQRKAQDIQRMPPEEEELVQ